MKTVEGLQQLKEYCKKVKYYTKVQADVQQELLLKAKNGDKEAMARVIENNLSFVLFVIKSWFYHPDYDYMELVSLGNLGLIKAVRGYDNTLGVSFTHYAYQYINWEILIDIRKKDNEPPCDYLDDVVRELDNGDEITLKDIIIGEKDIITEHDIKEQEYIKVINESLAELDKIGWNMEEKWSRNKTY